MIRPTTLYATLLFYISVTMPMLQLSSCASETELLKELNESGEESDPISNAKITNFSFLSIDNDGLTTDIFGTLDETTKTVYIELDPLVIPIEQLVPTIAISPGSTVSPTSKTTQDFSHELSYTVTSDNGTKTTYKIIPSIIGNICTANLQDSGPIKVTANNQRIENLYIRTTNQHGIEINNYTGVVISNCIIEYTGAFMGIKFTSADNLTIKNCSIKYVNAPAKGPLEDAERNCIEGIGSKNILITNVRVEDGSTGIRLNQCDDSVLKYIEGHNMRGPFPRGQLVQYDKCVGGLLENFSVINDRDIAWTEDNISIYKSGGQQIKKGLIVGNNSPTGVGVLFEDQNTEGARGGYGGIVEDVDFLEMGNGVASSVEGSKNVTFTRIRAKQIICGDLGQNRGKSTSNSLIFAAFGTTANTGGNKIIDCIVYNSCNPTNIVWPEHNFDLIDYKDDIDFEPRKPIVLNFTCPSDN